MIIFCFQIGDFGMTRNAAYTYDLSKPEQIPLRWTAPEVHDLDNIIHTTTLYI